MQHRSSFQHLYHPGFRSIAKEINIDYSNDLIELPAEIFHLIKLKKISITICHKLIALPREIGKLVNLEILRLSSCIELLELPHTNIGGVHKLRILDISECLEIKRLPEEIGEVQNLSTLHMISCSNYYKLPSSILNLKHLEEVVCDEETASLWEGYACAQEFENIKKIVFCFLNWIWCVQFQSGK